MGYDGGDNFNNWIDCNNIKKNISNLFVSAFYYYSDCLLCRNCSLVKHGPYFDCAFQSETELLICLLLAAIQVVYVLFCSEYGI